MLHRHQYLNLPIQDITERFKKKPFEYKCKIGIHTWYQKDGGGKVWSAENLSHFDDEKKGLRVKIQG